MNSSASPLLYGVISAVSLGCADFVARYTSRALGQNMALLSTFAVTVIVFFPLYRNNGMLIEGINWDIAVLIFHGGMITVGMLLLYLSLARGPINVVAPIVAAHPVFVVFVAIVMGSRPSILQWVLVLLILIGVLFVVVGASSHRNGLNAEQNHPYVRRSVLIAVAASFSYGLMVSSGQSVSIEFGPVGVFWLGHFVALAVLVPWIIFNSKLKLPSFRWCAVLIVQGCLHASGMLFLLLGSQAAFPEITAVISSEFSVVTIFLAWIFLRESMSYLQLLGLVLLCVSTAALILEESI